MSKVESRPTIEQTIEQTSLILDPMTHVSRHWNVRMKLEGALAEGQLDFRFAGVGCHAENDMRRRAGR